MNSVMRKNRQLQPYLPHTVKWSKTNFYNMLRKHKSIVIKPNNGKKGQNIYFIKSKRGKYLVYINKKRKVFKSRLTAYKFIRKATRKRRFIIQPEINLTRIGNKRVDFRVIVQRKTLKSPWVVTGIIARKAGKGYKVTNRHRNGTVLLIQRAMKRMNLDKNAIKVKVKKIKRISLLAAKTLGPYFARQRIFAVDIGMDKNGSVYIFELNRWPGLRGFYSLKDKSQIRRIRAYLASEMRKSSK
jgi:glutathione synthase/RimK-type ligase-like ATP-grasp enzyme